MEVFSIAFATISLLISGTTAWLTLFRKGKIKMTQPTLFAFFNSIDDGLKIYFRTLLYCTAKRGRIVESMFLRLYRGETMQTFNVWVHGEDRIHRGSGLFVGQDGMIANHHFLLPKDGTNYQFLPGDYTFEIFASFVRSKRPIKLIEVKLTLTSDQAEALKTKDNAVFFDWGPDSQRYYSYIDKRTVPPKLKLP